MTEKVRTKFWFGLALGVAGGLILRRFSEREARMPNLARWQRAWREAQGTIDAAVFAADVQRRYDALYAQRPRFQQGALQSHLDDNILPGLAVYQVLREKGLPQDDALDHVQTLLATMVQPARRWLQRLGRFPWFFPVFRALIRFEMRVGFPPEGWRTVWIENSAALVAFDMHRCFFLDVLTAYDAPELTPLYCYLDVLLIEGVSPYLSWERTQTLALGGTCCDFRYRRLEV